MCCCAAALVVLQWTASARVPVHADVVLARRSGRSNEATPPLAHHQVDGGLRSTSQSATVGGQAGSTPTTLRSLAVPSPRARHRHAHQNSVAVFTIVRNEAYFLPVWLRHYGRHFDAHDTYVLDNGSTDGSTRGIAARVVPRPSPYFNDLEWLRRTVTSFQTELLRSGYDYVLFAEVDELIVHARGLRRYLAEFAGTGAAVTGYEVVHDLFSGRDEGGSAAHAGSPPLPTVEPDLDPARPILAQRSRAVRVPWWDKPLLTSTPIVYCKGFHVCLDGCDAPRDAELLLFHLHRADFKACYDRLTAKATREQFQPNEEPDQGMQQHFTGAKAAAYCLQASVNVTAHVYLGGLVAGGEALF